MDSLLPDPAGAERRAGEQRHWGDDTLDAGIRAGSDVLGITHALAAGWWLNDRPYHREVLRHERPQQGGVEEVRFSPASDLATAASHGATNSATLPPLAIRLMQQDPPANPPCGPLICSSGEVPSVVASEDDQQRWRLGT